MSELPAPSPEAPLRVATLLVTTYRYLRSNPGATLGVAALLSTITSAVSGVVLNGVLLGGRDNTALGRFLSGETLTKADSANLLQEMTDAVPLLAVVSAVSALIQLAAVGVMTLGMVRALAGERVGAAELWRRVPWARVILINLMIVGILLAASVVPLVGAAVLGGGSGLALIALALTVVLALTVATVLAVPAALTEDLRPWAAVRRSLQLTRRAWWRTAGLLLSGLLTWQVVASLIASPVSALAGAVAGGPSSAAGAALASLIAGIVAGAITLPADAATATLVYADLARRRDEPTSQ